MGRLLETQVSTMQKGPETGQVVSEPSSPGASPRISPRCDRWSFCEFITDQEGQGPEKVTEDNESRSWCKPACPRKANGVSQTCSPELSWNEGEPWEWLCAEMSPQSATQRCPREIGRSFSNICSTRGWGHQAILLIPKQTQAGYKGANF